MPAPSPPTHGQVIACWANEAEGLIHMKVVSLPYIDPVEFNLAEAKAFANQLEAAIAALEAEGHTP